MRTSACSVLGLLVLSSLAGGCAAEPRDETEDGSDAISSGASLTLEMSIAQSKVVYSSNVESFRMRSGAEAAPCRAVRFGLTSPRSLYDAGWSPDRAADFAESAPGARFRDYVLASCRDANTETLAWFGKGRSIELPLEDTLVRDDYRASELPLLVRHVALAGGQATYYTCDGAFRRSVTGETATEKRFDVSVSCRRTSAPTKAELGPVDFLTSPGPYAAVASYRPWMLPAVAATPESFRAVRAALLAKVPAGRYTGAMSTLSKTCGLSLDSAGEGLVIEHETRSSNRTRRLELKAETLRGFVEGELFADPIRAEGAPVGTFAAAEFDDGKGGSVVVRFEQQTGLDGRIVRFDGGNLYCRRLSR